MAEDRNRKGDDAPSVPESAREWGKWTSKSPDDFPDVERASAEQAERQDEKPAADAEAGNYRREKQDEGRRMSGPADAERGPARQKSEHPDAERDSRRPSRSGATEDAQGQAERGSIDQAITDKGDTGTR